MGSPALQTSNKCQICNMQDVKLFTQLLGIADPWSVESVDFDSIQHVVHEIVRVAVSDMPSIAIPADDAVELGVEIFKF
ncbi:hypothetical protein B7993_09025 [Fibrobacter sp. UWH3]|nr:hypothetical protein B7993_09025 [Fibrobacter sp. UWH3]